MTRPHGVVVGAGLVGAACAAALARQGWRVTVIEAETVGGGATAAGMGHLVVMDDSPAQLALTSLSLELWEALAPHLPVQADYRRCGTLWVASDEDERRGVLLKQRQYGSAGREATVLDAGELARLEPALRAGLAGALRVPGDAVVYAPVVARFLLERAGADVQCGEVVALDGRRVQLRDGRQLTADLTVVAGGAAAGTLLPELPLRARKGHLLITERMSLQVRHQLVELGYLKSAHASEADSVAFNVQPRPTGQLLIGSSRQFGPVDKQIDWVLLRRMLTRAAEFLPALPNVQALRLWTGLRSATPDHLPIIGPHPARPGVYLAVGHEGLGITTALATAALLRADLAGQPSPLPGVSLGLERFDAGAHHA
ncbi:FAD-dependent oxidoreductase (plasmid) [Deinococcus taeanensis]|uniref:NAD(P)/FAD-dependent oxidoreductase n=1 Tax=Deinococcus taeanensis TaxID=2737050 RepID=UPI001CDC486D|nr:FAD-dependent oxidoreductase [Deinococcus taeanensis]UBV44631.1 FAD-dependent oxidoreductase [Deinococcus taeanensis]